MFPATRPVLRRTPIGRTNSKRALGFIVSRGGTSMDFVLDRDQVAALAAYIQHCALPRLLKPLGRKRLHLLDLVLRDNSPKYRLQKELEEAASAVHPGYRVVDEHGTEEVDHDAPADVVRRPAVETP
jgi:hypothetical protein